MQVPGFAFVKTASNSALYLKDVRKKVRGTAVLQIFDTVCSRTW